MLVTAKKEKVTAKKKKKVPSNRRIFCIPVNKEGSDQNKT